MAKEKLEAHITGFRIDRNTKSILQQMADIKRRKLNEFIRINLEALAEDFQSGRWDRNKY